MAKFGVLQFVEDYIIVMKYYKKRTESWQENFNKNFKSAEKSDDEKEGEKNE